MNIEQQQAKVERIKGQIKWIDWVAICNQEEKEALLADLEKYQGILSKNEEEGTIGV